MVTMIHRIDVQITTPLNPTERREKVEEALLNLFPTAEIEERHGELQGEAHSLDHLGKRLREQAIVDTAREMFRAGLEGDAFSFSLKKQAAFEGIVNFAVGNPDELGDIHVRVRVEEPTPEEFIEFLAPKTPADEPG